MSESESEHIRPDLSASESCLNQKFISIGDRKGPIMAASSFQRKMQCHNVSTQTVALLLSVADC